MIHEENKKQQDETEDFSMDNFLPDERKKTVQTQQDRFTRPQIDEEAIMRVMAGEETAEVVRERMKQSASNPKRTTAKPKKLTKEDYCEQFFKIPTTTASKGKSVYVRQEYHDKFNRLTNIMRIDKLTIYAYLDNIIEYHFQEFGELISEIYNDKHKPLF
ncbi:DUF3408 domain-containing protein [Chryseobacterium binzhouense]|uniref:DUF3408 domain-containing protein n=1 Tax=Chryseobacterium binzhouense TaxID=2593646 RepID=UPI00117C2443|nr:DUF3408 domain-containing protein [Chryseobacterium binzhouense]